MRISGPRPPELQQTLFEEMGYEARVCTVAACRNYMGDFFEELTASLTGGTRLKTDSTKDICPDMEVRPGVFVESKSIGCSGSIIVYQNRLEKDLAFERTGTKLYYVMWRHRCKINEGIVLGDLRAGAANAARSVILIGLEELSALLKAEPVKVLNSKHTARGYGSHGYNNGYRLLYNKVAAILPKSKLGPVSAYGRTVETVDVYARAETLSDLVKQQN